jgi:predicted dehydrogenase
MTASAAPIGVGLVGYGLAGRSFHAPFIEAVEGLRLVAIVTSNGERRARALAEHPRAEVHAGVADLLGRDDLDVVVVASPNSTHAPIATRVLATGRHVVVDKPMAMDVGQAEALLAAAEKAGRILTVFQNRRWDGDFLTMRRLIEQGVLGSIDSLESRFERSSPVGPEWRESAAEAGGPLRDLGAHLVDQALVLFGPARRVWAQVDRRRPGSEVEDSAFVAIDHASGVRSRLWMSLIASLAGPRLRLRGLAGEYVKDDLDIQESQLVGGLLPSAPGFAEDPPERWGRLHVPGGPTTRVRTEPGRYRTFYELLRDAIRGAGPPPVLPTGSLQVLRILEAAERSAASGASQDMAEA